MVNIEIFKLFGSIFVDNEKANESISKTDDKAKGLTKSLGQSIKDTAKWAAGIGASVGAGAAALYGMANKAADATDKIDKMSQKIGLSRQAYQEFDFICSQSGMSVDALQGGMKSLTAAMDGALSGSKKNAEQFKRLGIEVSNADGSLRKQEDVLMDTLTALQGMENQTEKARLATELFGKSGTELMPLLNGASGSIEEMREKAHELGLVMSDESIDAGVQFTDTIDQLKRSFKTATNEVGVSLMPAIQGFADFVIQNMPVIQSVIGTVFGYIETVVGFVVTAFGKLINKGKELYENNQETIALIEEKLLEFWEYLKGLFADVEELLNTFLDFCIEFWEEYGKQIMGVVGPIWETIKKVIDTALQAIKGIIKLWTDIFKGDWKAVWEDIGNLFNLAWELIKEAVPKLIEAVINAIKLQFTFMYNAGRGLFDAVWDGMKSVWTGIFNWVNEKISWLTDKLAFWKTSSDSFQNADGGTVNGSHAQGLEYVPFDGYQAQLHKGERVLTAQEASGGLAQQIINGLSAVMGNQGTQSVNINVVLDGKTVAKALYNPLKQEAYRLGEVF